MPGCATTTVTSTGLSPALRQLRDCRHTVVAVGVATTTATAIPTSTTSRRSDRVVPKPEGCLTCKLAARVMKEIEKEQRAAEVLRQQEKATRELIWARSCRNILLMRHPTNWAGASLLQGPLPSNAQARGLVSVDYASRTGTREAGWDRAQGRSGRTRTRNDASAHGGASVGGVGDSRPKLVPGVMLTLSALGAEAIMELTEEVHCEKHPGTRAQKALGIVHEATAEVAFANRRDSLRTGVLTIKLQAVARGWLARRYARVLLLRGGCRRELDQASGAWQYVWRYRSVAGAALDNTRGRGSEPRLSCRAGCGGDGGGGGGEAFFRSWYPPALLKNEALPSPRAATRRVETEGRKREARLAFANSLLDDQKERLSKRDVRAEWLLALAEVVKSVERATGCLEGAAVDCLGMGKASPGFSVRVLHPRGGQPGDGERDAVSAETLAAWRLADTKRREQEEAAAIRAAHDSRRSGKSPRSNSPAGAGGRREAGRLEHSPTSGRESGGRRKRQKEVSVVVPTTNDNLADFEQRALEASLHNNAFAAVASLLQRKRAVVAIRESARLSRNKDAWGRSGTSPFCIGIQCLPPWLDASRKFIAFAHRGRLVAISQASPFVYWETLVAEESRSQVLRGVLEPFLKNADLLKAMFAPSVLPATTTGMKFPEEYTAGSSAKQMNASVGKPSFNTTTAAAAAATSTGIGDGSGGVRVRGQGGRGDGAWSQPLPSPAAATATAAAAATAANVAAGPASGRNGASDDDEEEEEDEDEDGDEEEEPGGYSSWGYLSSLASGGCWKVDAVEIARRDDSVKLEFDSIAFEVFVRVDDRGSERWKAAATGGESEAKSTQQDKPTSSTTTSGGRAESPANHRAREHDGDAVSSIPRAVVTNAMPFLLEHGLPRELGPLLFDASLDADILAGETNFSKSSMPPETDALPKTEALPERNAVSNSNPNEQKKKKDGEECYSLENGSAKQNWANLNEQEEEEEEEDGVGYDGPENSRGKQNRTNLNEQKQEDDDDDDDGYDDRRGRGRGRENWTRKPDPLGTGEVFSHLVRGGGSDDGGGVSCVEVRLRAAPLGAEQLAKAGLPKDGSALVVVGVNDDDTGNGKGASGGGGGGDGVGASGGKAGTSRAH